MGGFMQPAPATEERETNWRAILIGAVLIIVAVGVLILVSSTERKAPAGPPPYAANLKISDLKMSAAENFVGATVSYIDGTITNSGQQTVMGTSVRVIFKDSMGQTVGDEKVPLHIL